MAHDPMTRDPSARRSATRRLAFALLAIGLGAIGCSGEGPMVETEGTVTIRKKPAANVMVTFWPEGPGPTSSATTDANGRYVLQSERDGRNGAVAGKHRIVLTDLVPLAESDKAGNGSARKPIPSRFPPAYENITKTPLSKTVEAGKTNTIDFDVP